MIMKRIWNYIWPEVLLPLSIATVVVIGILIEHKRYPNIHLERPAGLYWETNEIGNPFGFEYATNEFKCGQYALSITNAPNPPIFIFHEGKEMLRIENVLECGWTSNSCIVTKSSRALLPRTVWTGRYG